MKKIDLILIVVLAVLLVAAFSPEQITGVHAAAFEQAVEAVPVEQSAPVSPVPLIAIALLSVLFGGMTFLPLLREDNNRHAADK